MMWLWDLREVIKKCSLLSSVPTSKESTLNAKRDKSSLFDTPSLYFQKCFEYRRVKPLIFEIIMDWN